MRNAKTILLVAAVHIAGCLSDGNSTKETGEGFLMGLIWECTNSGDVGICLKSKAADLLDKLVKTKQPLRINEYLSLAREPSLQETEDPDVNEVDGGGEKTSEEMAEEKSEKLDGIIWGRLSSFFRTRSVYLTVPPANGFEGRGKGDKIFKKGYGFFLMAAMMGGMMMKLFLAKIALIAGKALVIGKIALILSLIISLKKFIGNGGGGGGHPEVVYASSEHAARSWPRTFRLDPQ